jgi:stage II sporulation protein D
MNAPRRALIATVTLASACRPGEPAREPGPAIPTGREPLVRVGVIVDQPEARVGAPGAFELLVAGGERLASGRSGEQWAVRAVNGMLEASTDDGRTTGPIQAPLRVSATAGIITIGGRSYHGDALITARSGDAVTVVNALALETYLRGVVPHEIGRRPPAEIEAVKAQAVAARTYAIGNMGARSAFGFDFFATVQDQVYGGIGDEDSVANRAIAETRGVVATWQGRPIIAYYSSTCGGRTASIRDAWPWRPEAPYLRSVSDRIPGGNRAYCDASSRYRWTTTWTRSQLLEVLAGTLTAHKGRTPGAVNRVERIALTNHSGTGTVSVDVRVDGQDYHVPADSVRWVLRPHPGAAILNSARITELHPEMSSGEVTGLHVQGTGWGHAVGMCQFGAIGRAREGQSHRRILETYYTGIDLTDLY